MPKFVELRETVDEEGNPLFLGRTADTLFKRPAGFEVDPGDIYVTKCGVVDWLLCTYYHNGFCGLVRPDSIANRVSDDMRSGPSIPWCSKPTPGN